MRLTGGLSFLLALCAATALTGCKDKSAAVMDIDVIGTEAAPFEAGVRLSTAGQLVRSATSEGLVTLDEQGRVIPALADRWIITDDGLSYIFRLRDGVWADGRALSGETARIALRQALDALAGTPLALDLADIDDIRAMAGRVVEIRLARPVPDLLQLLAQPELGLMHNGKSNGPMALKRDGRQALLNPVAPAVRGLPEPDGWRDRARGVRLRSLSASVAIQRFGGGDVDVVLGGRYDSYPLAATVGGLSRRMLRVDPAAGLFGLIVASGQGFLAAPENREALALAIDRESLPGALGLSSWQPTTRIVAAGSAGDLGTIGERWTDLTPERRKAEAAARVARWKAQQRARPTLRLAIGAGPGADALFARLAADWGAIGVTVQRVGEGADADVRLVDAVARYARPEWYLNQLSCAAGRGLCSAAADARLAEARAAADPAQRSALLAEAEAELTAANVYLPLGSPIRWTLVRDGITGFSVNPQAFHPLLPLATRPG